MGNPAVPSQFYAQPDAGNTASPNTVTVGYGTDSAGQHITYAHSYTGQTDLSAGIQLTSGSHKLRSALKAARLIDLPEGSTTPSAQ